MADEIRRGTMGKPKVRREMKNGWTQARRELFLNHLAATCNVQKACEVVGMHVVGVYALRGRDLAFAEQWRAALLTGYDRLEAAVLEQLLNPLNMVEHAEVETAPFDRDAAIAVIKMHHARLAQHLPKGGPRLRRATEQETDAAILRQLAALNRRTKAEEA